LLQKLLGALDEGSETLKNGDVLVIASKVVAYSQGLLLKTRISNIETRNKSETRNSNSQNELPTFEELIHQEADKVLEEGEMVLTMKNKVLIPNAGIDSSNTPEGEVILWPKEPFQSARDLRKALMEKFGLDELGIVISDSHCQPLRMGTSGIGIGWAGFEGVHDEIGSKDLYGREMRYTKIAAADNLASAANMEMGETDASIPFVIIRDAKVRFSEAEFSEKDYFISPDECIYSGLYNDKLT